MILAGLLLADAFGNSRSDLGGKWGRSGYCFSLSSPTTLPSSEVLHSLMALLGTMHSGTIPENEEIPQTSFNSAHQANGNEDERVVSKLQRRHSDVKVYKEFCDFYAKL